MLGLDGAPKTWQSLIGTAIHDAISRHWLNPRATPDVCADFDVQGVDRWRVIAAQEIVREYCHWYADDAFSEVESELPFDGTIRGIVDKRCVSTDGTRTIVDHKTTGRDISYGSKYFEKKMALDSQIDAYLLSEPGDAVMIIDAIRRYDVPMRRATPVENRKYTLPSKSNPVPRLYKGQLEEDETEVEYRDRARLEIATSKDRRFRRVEIFRTTKELNLANREFLHTLVQIRTCAVNSVWPRNGNACGEGAYACEYSDLCIGYKGEPAQSFTALDRAF